MKELPLKSAQSGPYPDARKLKMEAESMVKHAEKMAETANSLNDRLEAHWSLVHSIGEMSLWNLITLRRAVRKEHKRLQKQYRNRKHV